MSNFGVYGPNSGRTVRAQLKVLIADITLTNPASFEDVPIPAGFDHVQIMATLISTPAAANDTLYMYFNGDYTATNYWSQRMGGSGGSSFISASNTPRLILMPAANQTFQNAAPAIMWIFNTSNPNVRKVAHIIHGYIGQSLDVTHLVWNNNSPLRSITIRTDNHPTDLLMAGCRLQVFGLGTFAVALAR